MKTAVIGFPRIGALRELKFSSEKYFRNEITEEELLETGRTLRKTHWKIQKDAGIDFISCNHFETEVGPGVYDIHSARVSSVEEIVTALKGMLEKIEPDKLWVNPDCGLKTRGVKETDASLRNMVAAVKEIR